MKQRARPTRAFSSTQNSVAPGRKRALAVPSRSLGEDVAALLDPRHALFQLDHSSTPDTETPNAGGLRDPRFQEQRTGAMSCCSHCQESGDLFDREKARGELRTYRENGTPESPTSLLVDGLKTLDLKDRTLLDVGGGIGMIPCELLPEGVSESLLVEASTPYLDVAEQEARRRGYGDRTEFEYGDFVDLAPDLPDADLVTLDRVFCCYPHMERLVEASASKATRWYGVTYPKERWYNKIISALAAVYCWARDMDFRMYIHSGIQETIEAQGFERFYQTDTVIWQVELYEREGALG